LYNHNKGVGKHQPTIIPFVLENKGKFDAQAVRDKRANQAKS
jgi:hypothetical protein